MIFCFILISSCRMTEREQEVTWKRIKERNAVRREALLKQLDEKTESPSEL